MTVGSNTLRFGYDTSGPLYVNYNGTVYYYVTNLQGDIVAIVNNSGSPVVEYTYDAWGKLLTTTGSMASTLGVHNPLRYRGYVYDTETSLYYVSSRYYDPEIGRFINADVLVSTGQGVLGNNMFAYCRNNPVCRTDITGTTDVACADDGTNLLDEEKSVNGGQMSTGDSSNAPMTVNNYLESHGQNPSDVRACFSGEPKLQTLTEDTTVFRTWGGTTSEYGHWVSPYNYGDAARSQLSLPPGNSMAYTSSFVIPAGTTVLAGVASPLFGQPGGGIQWWIHHIACQSQM